MCIIALYLISRSPMLFRGQHFSLLPHYFVLKLFDSLYLSLRPPIPSNQPILFRSYSKIIVLLKSSFSTFHNEIVAKLILPTRLKRIADFRIKSKKKVLKQKITFIKLFQSLCLCFTRCNFSTQNFNLLQLHRRTLNASETHTERERERTSFFDARTTFLFEQFLQKVSKFALTLKTIYPFLCDC